MIEEAKFAAMLVDYDACDRLATDILEKINERNRYERHSSSYSQMSVKIRQAIKVFDNDVSNLKQNLLRASSSYYLTQREVERRQNMMDALAVREKQVRDYSSGRGPIVGSSALLGDGLPSGGGTVNWGYEETDETRDLTVDDIVNQQQQVIKEQDKGLETLYSVVSRQKQMAQNIGNEVDVQNELIDDITDHVDRTDNRLRRETHNVKIIDRKSNACCYWVVIILLLIAIVVVIAVPYNGKK